MKIASAQFSYRFGQQIYMPYAIGILASYLKKHIPGIEFLPTAVDRSVVHDYAKIEADILLCSCYVWNWEINKVLMREWKLSNPNGLVIVGGPQIPSEPSGLLSENPDIDVIVHGEGEDTLLCIVSAIMEGKPLDGITGASTRTHPQYQIRLQIKDLDIIPSPYTDGTMGSLIELEAEEWLATWETMRGCPYGCSFCVADSTEIMTYNGVKRIRDVQIGERVLGLTDTVPTYGKVTNSKKSEGRACVEIVTSYGTLTLTPEHRIYEKTKGWIEAGECRVGDYLYRMRQTGASETQDMFEGVLEKRDEGSFRNQELFWDAVIEVKDAGLHTVVDIEVSGTHDFFADGLLVHNCEWGLSSYTNIRRYTNDRLLEDINWFATNKIAFIECADANFGMFPRDTEITQYIVDANTRHGYPKTFKPSWAKKMNARVIDIAKQLNKHGLLTSVGCSLQSLDSDTLKAVHRMNVTFDEFVKIINTFKENGTQCFTEIIRGLPGETLESFMAGLDRIIFESNVDTVYIYNCSMLENTDMKSPAFMSYKLETVHSPIYFAHSSSGTDEITEYADLVISSSTFTRGDMEQMYLYSWYILAFQQLGILNYITKYLVKERGMSYREFFNLFESHCKSNPDSLLGQEYASTLEYIRDGYAGKGWNKVDPKLGPIVWPIDEATWLRVTMDKTELRREIYGFLGDLLTEELCDLIEFQIFTLMDRGNTNELISLTLDRNWINYFTTGALSESPTTYSYQNKITQSTDDFDWNTKAIWYGRRKMNYRARLEDIHVN